MLLAYGPTRLKGRVSEHEQDVAVEVHSLDARVEKLDRGSRASNIMMFGLSEEASESAFSLAASVAQQLHEAAPAFSLSAVVRAQRIRKPCATKPRPVRVTLASPNAKHAAFKAKKSLRQQHVRLDDDLTKAQQRRRAQIRQFATAVRERQPKSNPHFMGDVLYVWERGRRLLFEDSLIIRRCWLRRTRQRLVVDCDTPWCALKGALSLFWA